MTLSLAHQAVRAVVVAGGFMITADAVGAPRSVAEFTLQRQESQPKWIPEGKPLFGDYLGSGDGSGSGALVGRIDWDLYEDQSRDDRHPAWFRGFSRAQRAPVSVRNHRRIHTGIGRSTALAVIGRHLVRR
jgi:hypothetical protein